MKIFKTTLGFSIAHARELPWNTKESAEIFLCMFINLVFSKFSNLMKKIYCPNSFFSSFLYDKTEIELIRVAQTSKAHTAANLAVRRHSTIA